MDEKARTAFPFRVLGVCGEMYCSRWTPVKIDVGDCGEAVISASDELEPGWSFQFVDDALFVRCPMHAERKVPRG